MTATFKERLVLDREAGAWFDQSRRYMMIRPEALMGIFRPLPEPERARALAALEASIFEQGSDSARAYVAMGGTGEALLGVIEATAPELGWGLWRFARGEGTVSLEVRNSPFAAGFGPSRTPVCAAIAGMARAVSTIVLGRPTIAVETQCAAMGAENCRFEARVAESG